MTTLIDPRDETVVPRGKPAARLDSLKGKTVGLLDISKAGGSHFLDRLEVLLKERFGVAKVIRDSKPTFTKPAPEDVLARLRGCAAVIEALAD
jgi:hypothetical protein